MTIKTGASLKKKSPFRIWFIPRSIKFLGKEFQEYQGPGHLSIVLNFSYLANIHIALLGAFGTWGWVTFLGHPTAFLPPLVIFSLIYGIYNINGKTDNKEDLINCKEKLLFQMKYQKILMSSSVILLCANLPFILPHGSLLAFYGFLLAVGIFYSYPSIPYLKNWELEFISLKKIPLVKNIAAGGTFAAGLLLFPVHYLGITMNASQWMLLATFSISSIGITIFSDIEDVAGDRASGIKTLPVLLGAERTSNIVVGVLALWLLFSSWLSLHFQLQGAITLIAALLFGHQAYLHFGREKFSYLRKKIVCELDCLILGIGTIMWGVYL